MPADKAIMFIKKKPSLSSLFSSSVIPLSEGLFRGDSLRFRWRPFSNSCLIKGKKKKREREEKNHLLCKNKLQDELNQTLGCWSSFTQRERWRLHLRVEGTDWTPSEFCSPDLCSSRVYAKLSLRFNEV